MEKLIRFRETSGLFFHNYTLTHTNTQVKLLSEFGKNEEELSTNRLNWKMNLFSLSKNNCKTLLQSITFYLPPFKLENQTKNGIESTNINNFKNAANKLKNVLWSKIIKLTNLINVMWYNR